MLMHSPISAGELIDKITILQIKQERILDEDKQQHIKIELNHLTTVFDTHRLDTPAIKELLISLKTTNETLWDIEDDIRLCEKDQDFSDKFIQLARKVYFTNDIRAAIKREINELTNSAIHEVKSYEEYA